uniref:Uncharacterized protein n=1 Tax=Coccidioides posadasii RMSCC 3488 TaxID=454284 RepID=A0A0J6FMZ7_COCPO|nr:hypothetical protein CPAG_06591 [Coccidioides posadasii RMSCC 3488]
MRGTNVMQTVQKIRNTRTPSRLSPTPAEHEGMSNLHLGVGSNRHLYGVGSLGARGALGQGLPLFIKGDMPGRKAADDFLHDACV